MDMNLIDHAEPLIKEALKHSPESIQASKIMGQIQTVRGNWQEAERTLTYALQHEPRNRSLQESLLLLYAGQKKFQKAIDLLLGMEIRDDTAEESDSKSYQHYMNLAGAYFSMKEFEKAERFLLRSKDNNPCLLNTVDNSVWKTVYKTTPNVFYYDWPGSWIVNYFLNAVKHLDRKIITKSLFTFFIVFDSFVKLCFSIGMK